MQRTSSCSYLHSVKERIFPAYPHFFPVFQFLLAFSRSFALKEGHHLKTYYHEKLTDSPHHERIRLHRLHEEPLLRRLGKRFITGSDPMALGRIPPGLSASVLIAPLVRAPLRGALFYAFTPLCGSRINPVFPLFFWVSSLILLPTVLFVTGRSMISRLIAVRLPLYLPPLR